MYDKWRDFFQLPSVYQLYHHGWQRGQKHQKPILQISQLFQFDMSALCTLLHSKSDPNITPPKRQNDLERRYHQPYSFYFRWVVPAVFVPKRNHQNVRGKRTVKNYYTPFIPRLINPAFAGCSRSVWPAP